MKYLSESEQFKDILNNEEISRIYDPELREIRERYWLEYTRIFKDEQNISDQEFNKLSDDLYKQEQKELHEYKLRHFDKYMNAPVE